MAYLGNESSKEPYLIFVKFAVISKVFSEKVF